MQTLAARRAGCQPGTRPAPSSLDRSGVSRQGSTRQGKANESTRDASDLLPERTGRVWDAVLPTRGLDHGRDLGVAIGGQVREEVMLDLVAQVPRENVEPIGALDVGGPSNLSQVPR